MFQGLCHGDAVPWEWGGHQEGLVVIRTLRRDMCTFYTARQDGVRPRCLRPLPSDSCGAAKGRTGSDVGRTLVRASGNPVAKAAVTGWPA